MEAQLAAEAAVQVQPVLAGFEAAIIGAVATVVSSVVTATVKPKPPPPPPTPKAPAEPGDVGAKAAAAYAEKRRRRLALGRAGTVTGAGRGLLGDVVGPGSEG